MAGDEPQGRSRDRDRRDPTQPAAPPEVTLFREPEEPGHEPDLDLEGSEPTRIAPRPRSACTIAVGGAKGGAGASVVAANLALYLASIGRRVLLVDAAASGATLHTLVGVPDQSRARSSRDAVVPVETSVQGLRLVRMPIDGGLREREGGRRHRLARSLPTSDVDYLVIDLGACTSRHAIEAFLDTDLSLLVSMPEPTALEATYRFLRRAFLVHLRRRVADPEVRKALVRRARALGGAPSPLDLWRSLEDDGDPLAELVRDAIETFHPNVAINQTRLRVDLELGDQVRSAAKRRLGIGIEYLGHIEYDDTVWTCVRSRRLLLIESPGTKASKNIEKVARRLLALQTGKRKPPARTVPPESHHDLLEVERGATDEEVRRAFKRAKEIYAEDALACYALFEPHELVALRSRLEEAYDVLLDPARRRPYELSVFPPSEEHDEPTPIGPELLEPLPPPPELTPDTDYSGAILRAVRESQGVSLREISTRTKVGLGYLEAIESDDFGALPAPVYVRGFVTEFAKQLRLDAAQVARTYARRYRRYLEERGRS